MQMPSAQRRVLVLYSMADTRRSSFSLGADIRNTPFGMAPCPMTVFTLGILLWSSKKPKWYVLVIPVLYSLSGLVPVSRDIVEDYGLFISGLITIFLVLYWERTKKNGAFHDVAAST